MKEWIYALKDCLDGLEKEIKDPDNTVKKFMILQDEIAALQSLLDFVNGYLYGREEKGKGDA